MRISEKYGLPYRQSELEFVDVDVEGDTKLFIDPRAIRDLDSDFGRECVAQLQSFFSTVIRKIQQGDDTAAIKLLGNLNEPNETRLGLSRGVARGKAVGEELSADIWEALTHSEAARTGILEDLEDTALLIKGISHDIVSDMTTNIIRGQLIEYTARMVEKYPSIEVENDVYVGPQWDRHQEKWSTLYVTAPKTRPVGPLVLVPKSIVRRDKLTFDPGEYLNHYILPHLQSDELRANSSLVEVLKNGRRRVTKKSLKEKYGIERAEDSTEPPRSGKSLNLEITLDDPSILDDYRAAKKHALPVMTHEELADVTSSGLPEWDKLLSDVLDIPTGKEYASKYHLAVEHLFNALLYPALDFAKHEYNIHEGRKRIDITYTNIARQGFFEWINRIVDAPAHEVYVECKNYSKDIGNPELDQIRGRFSDIRSNVGLMVFRGTTDKNKILEGCRDTAHAGHGFIFALDDDDLKLMVEYRKRFPDDTDFPLLRQRYDKLVN